MSKVQRWQEVKREIAYKKYSQVVERRDYKMPDGNVKDYYVRIQPSGVCALALTADNEVITVLEYRPGPDAILQELPGGMIDEGESPQQAGVRELMQSYKSCPVA